MRRQPRSRQHPLREEAESELRGRSGRRRDRSDHEPRTRPRSTPDSLDVEPRLMRRPRRRSRNRRRGLLGRVPRVVWLLAILIAEIVVVGLRDPRFCLARIDVRGGKVLTSEQVARRSGLQVGVNLFRLRLKDSRQRLLAVPAVAEVSLHRRIPNRVVIRVKERRPMACVAAQNGLFTIDDGGMVFRADEKAPSGLPLVSGMEAQPLVPGQRIDAAQAGALKDCLAAAAANEGHPLTRISIDQNGNLCFNSAELGYQVRLGPAEQLQEKFALLAALERSMPDVRQNCEYIDVSCLEAPAWKPKKVAIAPGGPADAARPLTVTGESLHGRGRIAQD